MQLESGGTTKNLVVDVLDETQITILLRVKSAALASAGSRQVVSGFQNRETREI